MNELQSQVLFFWRGALCCYLLVILLFGLVNELELTGGFGFGRIWSWRESDIERKIV